MTIVMLHYITWNPDFTTEKQNEYIKRLRQAAEKNGFKVTGYYVCGFGCQYTRVIAYEFPNYAGLDKMVETPELSALIREAHANSKGSFDMLWRALPLP